MQRFISARGELPRAERDTLRGWADVDSNGRVGDQITANVYDGDYTLYDIEVVKAPAKTKKKK